MRYRTFGNTGLPVSVLSLGVSSFGGAFGPVDERACKACVDRALDSGINYLDTAPYYGETRSEAILGRCLVGVPRDRYLLATKVGRYGDTLADFDFSSARVRLSVDQSLSRLGVDYVDVLQCHDIEFASLDQIAEETIPALREVVKLGKARFVGITGLPLGIYREILNRTYVDVVLSYCHYALHDTTLASELPWLESKGVGIISASPLAMGLLTEDGPPNWHPAPQSIRDACRRAVEHCHQTGANIAELALKFAVRNNLIHTTLVGTYQADQITANARWIDEPIDERLLKEVLEILNPIKDQTWRSGRLENSHLSGEQVPERSS
jgi:L-galactose dehydrogenase